MKKVHHLTTLMVISKPFSSMYQPSSFRSYSDIAGKPAVSDETDGITAKSITVNLLKANNQFNGSGQTRSLFYDTQPADPGKHKDTA